MKKTFTFIAVALLFAGCASEDYSNGERIGLITQFSRAGIFWKSWEGHLNVTQTGMNSSVPFDFSVDNDAEPPLVIRTLDSAARFGWKVKLVYHETFNKNWFSNRGETNHFITRVDVLDRNMTSPFSRSDTQESIQQKQLDQLTRIANALEKLTPTH
ncbi:MAG: hypothetical protein JSS75_07300 [Bacteroidetes bacterium]|nr:hypothetical protein [Bacteroidota bacterium]